MSKPYSIITPPFEVTSGGIRVMWGLYGWLLAKGQIAFINKTIENTDFIGIYPEIFRDNPAKATKVVRYILQKPGLATLYGVPGPTTFDPNDKLIYFSKIYAPPGVKDEDVLFLPVLDLHLFKDYGKKRTKSCYLVGKGMDTFKHPLDAIFIDRNFANNQKALADLLNECEVMYSYDPVTAMFEVARLCGTRVVIIPDEKFKVDISLYEPGLEGISYLGEPAKPFNSEKFRDHYQDMIRVFDKKLDNFIEVTQKW